MQEVAPVFPSTGPADRPWSLRKAGLDDEHDEAQPGFLASAPLVMAHFYQLRGSDRQQLLTSQHRHR